MDNSYDQNISYYNYNYYDPNYYYTYNLATEQRFDSYYENNIQYYPNIESRIATNIAHNYRQSTNGLNQDYNWHQTIYNANYELNNFYNTNEQYNGFSTLAEDLNSNSIEIPFNEIQNYSHLDKRNPSSNRISERPEAIIPTTVEDLEKEIKIEKDFNSINETEDKQQNYWHSIKLNKQINNNCDTESLAYISGSGSGSADTSNTSEKNLVDLETLSTVQKQRQKNKRLMSFDELIREKRESNRLAAIKCRQKKLSQLDSMENKTKHLVEENQKLEQRLNKMRAQLLESKLALIYHRNSGCLINPYHN